MTLPRDLRGLRQAELIFCRVVIFAQKFSNCFEDRQTNYTSLLIKYEACTRLTISGLHRNVVLRKKKYILGLLFNKRKFVVTFTCFEKRAKPRSISTAVLTSGEHEVLRFPAAVRWSLWHDLLLFTCRRIPSGQLTHDGNLKKCY